MNASAAAVAAAPAAAANAAAWAATTLRTHALTLAAGDQAAALLVGLQQSLPSERPTARALAGWAAVLLAGLALWEQLRFWAARKGLPGPAATLPFLGGIVAMVRDPHAFWEQQRGYATPGLSWNAIVGWFTVHVSDPALVRHVFNHNSKDTLLLELHPNARMVLGNKNIAFMHGPPHKALRKSFLALFTRKALSVYVTKQDAIIRRHLAEWVATPGAREVRGLVRDMNAFTSQEVFVGPYLDDPKVRAAFSDAFRHMTEAFLALPLKFPGTSVWRGYQGRLYIIRVLTEAAARSKVRMAAGGEPDCLLDFWTQQILRDCEEADAAGAPRPGYAPDEEMAYVAMDFLFASQDASTASLVWELVIMAERPDLLARVREEQARVRPDPGATLNGDALAEMPFTRQVVKEVLRYRPPAPMVPQMAQRPFKLGADFTAPRGTLIIPDIVSACRQGFSDPTSFDPDRFGPERKEDVTHAANFMVFGHGPHYCVGKEYALNHLTVFLAITSLSLDWSRIRTPDSDHILYLPTIYPHDSIIEFKSRAPPSSRSVAGGGPALGGDDAVAAAISAAV